MSHSVMMVIGNNVEEILAPYNENLKVPEYDDGEISEDDIKSFINFYTTGEHENNKNKSLDELAKEYSEVWDGNPWKKVDNKWHTFSTYNPKSKWDWYQEGGRWSGYFKIKEKIPITNKFGLAPNELKKIYDLYKKDEMAYSRLINSYKGYEKDIKNFIEFEVSESGDLGLVLKNNNKCQLGSPSLLGPNREDYTGRADICLKGDIDTDSMIKENEESFAERYDIVWKYLSKLSKEDIDSYKSWKDINEALPEDDKYSNDARNTYKNQKAVKVFEEACNSKEGKGVLSIFDSVDEYLVSREKYLELGRNSAITPFAFVNKDGWFEKGDMGWWGCVSNEKDADDWNKQFMNYFNSLSDDTQITIVDCHI